MQISRWVGRLMNIDEGSSEVNYEQLAEDLLMLECLPTASEYHGLVCGRLAANGQVQDPLWSTQTLEFLGLTAPDQSGELKRVLALPELMSTGLQDSDLGFQLWIPGDDYALEQRLVALAEWCSGFLLGIAWGGLDQPAWDSLSAELSEALNDLVAISGVDELSGGTEKDFMQLYEYVRMVALNVSAEVLLERKEAGGAELFSGHSVNHLFGPGKTRH